MISYNDESARCVSLPPPAVPAAGRRRRRPMSREAAGQPVQAAQPALYITRRAIHVLVL
eukprot:COSAG06_NODE_1941_length_8015_cov_2.703007_9_plen_59_part_00